MSHHKALLQFTHRLGRKSSDFGKIRLVFASKFFSKTIGYNSHSTKLITNKIFLYILEYHRCKAVHMYYEYIDKI